MTTLINVILEEFGFGLSLFLTATLAVSIVGMIWAAVQVLRN